MLNQNPNQNQENLKHTTVVNSANQLAIINPKSTTPPQKSPVKYQNQFQNLVRLFFTFCIGLLVVCNLTLIVGSGYIVLTQGQNTDSYTFTPRFNPSNRIFQDLIDVSTTPVRVKTTPDVIIDELDDSAIINANRPIYNPELPDFSQSIKAIQEAALESSSSIASSISSQVSSSSNSVSSEANPEPVTINSSSSNSSSSSLLTSSSSSSR